MGLAVIGLFKNQLEPLQIQVDLIQRKAIKAKMQQRSEAESKV